MDSTFAPDDSRRLQLQSFVGSICVGSTGRLGIVTHVQVENGDWTACGFGLDGKGVWTSGHPTEFGTAEAFYHKLKSRFHGRLSALDCLSRREIDDIVAAVVLQMGPDATVGFLSDELVEKPAALGVSSPEVAANLGSPPPNMPIFGGKIREDAAL